MKKEDWKALAMIAAFYGLLELWGITCPIKYLTGVSCPGCGMSRAWLSVLRLDLAGAWEYHPLYWLPVPGAALFLLRGRLPAALYRWGIGLICGLFLVVYAVRLLTPGNMIVVFRPQEGLFLRLLGIGR
ncbi:MAG: DUF2752 domain-containing protein [Oscillibacter sp.]|jgi:hypothetical protein|nr:DUF2752 domain-containing protein [Oscillibacter sp.]